MEVQHDAIEAVGSPQADHNLQKRADEQPGISGQSGAAGTPAVHPRRGAERSLEGWTELFSESNVTNFSSQEMLKSIKDLLKILRHQNGSFVPMLLGRYSAVPQAEAAIFIKGLFQGCSQMFTFMADDWAEDPSQGIDEMKKNLTVYFAAALDSTSMQRWR